MGEKIKLDVFFVLGIKVYFRWVKELIIEYVRKSNGKNMSYYLIYFGVGKRRKFFILKIKVFFRGDYIIK